MIKKWIIAEFFRKNMVVYILGILALIGSSLLQISIPKLIGYIIDHLTNKTTNQSYIFNLVFLLLGIAVILFILKFIWRSFLVGKARDLECFLRAKLFSHLQTLPVKFYNDKKTGDLMSYATNDLNAIRRAFAFGFVFLFDGIIINLASLFIMVKMVNINLTLFAIIPILLSALITLKMGKLIREKFSEVQESFSEISEKTQENISGIRVVKAYVQEDFEIEKLKKVSQKKVNVQIGYSKLSGLIGPIIQVGFGISYTLVLIVGSGYVKNNIISLGDFIAFNTYLALLSGPIMHLGKIVEVWQSALASMKRLDNIFLTATDIVDNNNYIQDTKFKGKINIKNLYFTYPGSIKRALKDINISLEPGKTLGVIGKTGSGKTTLVSLLLRLYKIGRGHIFIDDIDINDISIHTLRDNLGCVLQDNFLFSATIKDNIQFFNSIYTDEEVQEAAKMSSVYENIIEFPDGFDTVVGERGITLSGGQKQRISIARAIIKDPSILILDDCLSAVDTKTEEEILGNIKSILNGRTGIIIAHRISTIKHADEIIVLDRGRILEHGTHEQLINQKGHYYNIYTSQLAESKIQNLEEKYNE